MLDGPAGENSKMVMSAEAIVEQRRLRRSLMVWRMLAVAIIAAIAIGIGTYQFSGFDQSHVARVEFNGVILGSRDELRLLDEIADDPNVKALLIAVNSPGGTTTGGEALLDALDRIRAKKPVVATMGTIAASAGYMISLGADHIIARGSTITGSIGVLFQTASGEKLLDTIGVKLETVRSGPFKAKPGFDESMDDETRTVLQSMIDDSYDWFVGLVSDRRPFDLSEATRLADGRVYTGRQALDAKLIDQIGGEREARAWLERERSVSKDLPVRTWSVRPDNFFENLRNQVSDIVPFGRGAEVLIKKFEALINERVFLDGLVSVWQARDLNHSQQYHLRGGSLD